MLLFLHTTEHQSTGFRLGFKSQLLNPTILLTKDRISHYGDLDFWAYQLASLSLAYF